MKAVLALAFLLAVTTSVAAFELNVEVDTETESDKPKPKRALAPVKVMKSPHLMPKDRVIIVSKGDPRARPPTGTAAPGAPAAFSAADDVAPPAGYFAPGDAPSPAAAAPASAAVKPGTIVLKAGTPGAGCTAIRGQCILRTACTGANTVQTGLCPGNTYCCVPSTPIPAGGIGATLAASANAVCSSYKASGAVYSQPRRQFGMSVKYSDCSSFVQSVFEHAGYASVFGRANAQTQAMRNVIARRGGGYHKTDVKLGDIVMWASGSTGHVGIITKICTPTTFQFTGMGSRGCGPYPLNGACMTWQQMTAYGLGGSSGFQGYWTAR